MFGHLRGSIAHSSAGGEGNRLAGDGCCVQQLLVEIYTLASSERTREALKRLGDSLDG
jgi:hypothetical protein